jgi:hypothetical protein
VTGLVALTLAALMGLAFTYGCARFESDARLVDALAVTAAAGFVADLWLWETVWAAVVGLVASSAIVGLVAVAGGWWKP